MATNNTEILNAALAGAAAAILNGRDLSEAGGSTSLDDIIDAIATEVDSKIPLDESMNEGKANLCNQIVSGACAGRSFTSTTPSDYDGIATNIADLYNSLVGKLE